MFKLLRSLFVIPKRSMGFINNRSKQLLSEIGSREMVGHGWNGLPCYEDRPDYPFPSIRYTETTAETKALYEKQRGDWKLLTREEKRALYRANFRQTFAEFEAPRGDSAMVCGASLIFISAAIWLYLIIQLSLNLELPDSFKKSSQRAQLRRMIDLQVNPIEGLASEWDYEKGDWKVHGWRTHPNPFVKCPDDDGS